MKDDSNKTNTAKKLLTRGILAITISGIIALLIQTGFAEAFPNVQIAFWGCAGVGVWGMTDLVRSLFVLQKVK